jgi:ferric-dicitrate binding protein FerR (iron transport regulator)
MLRQHCDRAHEWVSLELDGELSEFERTLLDAHVAGCEPCRTFRVETDAITRELRSVHLEPLPTPVAVRSRRRSFRLAPAAAAAAVVAVALGSIVSSLELRNTFTSSPSQPRTARELDLSVNRLRLATLQAAPRTALRNPPRVLAGGPAVPRDTAPRSTGGK